MPPAFARWNVASQNIIIFLYDFIKKSLIFCFRRSISASRLWRSGLFLPSPAGCAGNAVERFRQFPAVPQGGESAGLLFSFVRAGFWCIANLLTVFSALCVIRKFPGPLSGVAGKSMQKPPATPVVFRSISVFPVCCQRLRPGTPAAQSRYPLGFFCCQFHEDAHISSMPYRASQPSSFRAFSGSAQQAATSPGRRGSIT